MDPEPRDASLAYNLSLVLILDAPVVDLGAATGAGLRQVDRNLVIDFKRDPTMGFGPIIRSTRAARPFPIGLRFAFRKWRGLSLGRSSSQFQLFLQLVPFLPQPILVLLQALPITTQLFVLSPQLLDFLLEFF